MNRKLRYLKDRVSNAWGMLRRGELISMLKAVFMEAGHRIESLRAWWYKRRQLDFSKIPGSAYLDRRKVLTGYRPTGAQRQAPVPMQADRQAVADEINAILGGITIQAKKRV